MAEHRPDARSHQSGSRSRRRFLAAGASLAAALAGCAGGAGGGSDGATGGGSGDTAESGGATTGSPSDATEGTDAPVSDSAVVFHAGSLAPPFSAAEPKFEDRYGARVTREAKGSVASTQKITQQGRSADVLGVSDFRLIRDRILPEFGDWYCIFATNAMAIQYREGAPGADEISTDNWWEVLSRDGVTIGHADPAVDPGGYRAVMTMQLGRTPFRGSRLYDDATYRALRENSTVPTGTETKLEGQLASGKLDYALYYQSIASTSELPWVGLQPEVDLSKATDEYATHYANAEVKTDSGTFTGAPIAYGMTVPSVARAPALGARWVEFFAAKPGQEILRAEGLQPVAPVVVPKRGEESVPDRVLQRANVKESLGPLTL